MRPDEGETLEGRPAGTRPRPDVAGTASRARPEAATTASSRVSWVDTGRGVAIILVVLYHAAQWLEIAGFSTATWQEVNDGLASLRMPLFFTISGMFAGKWLTVSWGRLWSGKVSLFVWVFMLWSFLATGPFILGLIMDGQSGNFFAQYQYVVTAPFRPRFELWFLWALVLFFVVSRLMRRVPPVVQVGGAALLALASLSGWDLGNVGWTGACKYFVFFLLGLYFRDAVFAVGRSRRGVVLGVVVLVWAALAAAGIVLDLNQYLGFYFLTALAGIVAGVSVSRPLSRIGVLARIGRRTLPIYLTHTSLILVLAWFLHYLPDPVRASSVVSWLVVPAVSLIAVVVGLAAATAAERRPLARYLFEAPPVVRRPRSGG